LTNQKKKKNPTTKDQLLALQEELEAQEAKRQELEASLKKVLEEFDQQEDFVKTVKELQKVPTSNIATMALVQERKRQEEAIKKVFTEKEANTLIAARAYLGTRGDKEQGIPPGAPLETENLEAINLVKNAVFAIARDKKRWFVFQDWKRERKRKWALVYQLKGEMADLTPGESDHIAKEQDLFRLVGDIAHDRFEFDKVPVTEEWIQEHCPGIYKAIETVRKIQVMRSLCLEERAYMAEEIAGVVKAGFRRDKEKTSTKMREALLELSEEFED